jgi:hypothetical protein
MLRDVIEQKVPVTENGNTRRLSALEVMFRKLANDAMRNDPRALKLILSLVERYEEPAEVERHLDELLAEDQEILAPYLEKPSGPVADTEKNSER